jgi:hypothetical protein
VGESNRGALAASLDERHACLTASVQEACKKIFLAIRLEGNIVVVLANWWSWRGVQVADVTGLPVAV